MVPGRAAGNIVLRGVTGGALMQTVSDDSCQERAEHGGVKRTS